MFQTKKMFQTENVSNYLKQALSQANFKEIKIYCKNCVSIKGVHQNDGCIPSGQSLVCQQLVTNYTNILFIHTSTVKSQTVFTLTA